MENNAVEKLNTMLKGEYMAIDAYDRFIRDVRDENIQNEFLKIQEDHKKHIEELKGRVRSLGGRPVESTGIVGFMANTMLAAENIINRDSLSILKKAYDGEDKGIGMSEKVVVSDLDNESKNMVEQILSDDHDHLKRMAVLISNFESKH